MSSAAAPDLVVASPLESRREAAETRKVLADRVDHLYSQLPLGIVATVATGLLAALELRQGRYYWDVVAWGIALVTVNAARAALYWGYRRSQDKIGEAEQWLRWLGIGALANGASWGYAGAVFFPSQADEQQVFLALLLAGAMAGGIPMYAPSWPMYAAYASGIALPFTYVLAAFGNRLFSEIALFVPFFYAVSVAIVWKLNQVFNAGYRLRYAYGRLTEDYSQLNRRLEEQLRQLTEARREVEASGKKLALFAERSPIPIMEFEPSGTVSSANPVAEHVFGFASSELIGRPVAEVLVGPSQRAEFARHWQDMFGSHKPLTALRIGTLRRDGQELVCEWSLTPLVNLEGKVLSVIGQLRDITQQLEADRLKREFTSTLSHELRTPLTSIIGSLQLVNSGVLGELDRDVAELTRVAERNSQRLLDLINDILDIEKIASGKLELTLEPLPLDELVRESVALNRAYADRFRVTLKTVEPLPALRVSGDRRRVQQVLTNLISNAAKFSAEGEVVELEVARCGTRARVSVHDRGPGIPAEFRSRIFGRFAQADMAETRRKGGTGLGLAICKRLVETMGGRIGFDDRVGGGTSFWFELALVPESAAPG